MKTNPDFEPEDVLLDTVLRDESWQTASAAFKAEAVGTFRRRQRARRFARWSAGVIGAAIVAGAALWLNRPAAPPPVVAQSPSPPPTPKAVAAPRNLSDEELLASFPAGSCFLAEVDGQKELVFVDPKLERLYVVGAQ